MLISGWATWPGCKAEPVRGPGARVRPVSAWQLRQIRVLLIEQTPTFEVAIRSPYRVTDAAGRELASVSRPLHGSQARVSRTVPPGFVLGGRLYKAKQIDVIPEDDGALVLLVNIDGRQKRPRRYRGRLRCSLTASGRIDVVNALDIEDFIDLLFNGGQPCNTCTGDTNGDGSIDALDIEPFLECLFP